MNVFSCLLNTVKKGTEVTIAGRLFHDRATITRKEWSPFMQSRVRSKISR